MRNINIQLQYGEHTFNRIVRAASIRAAFLEVMVFVKQELYLRDIGHVIVSRPSKLIVKVGV